MYVMNVCMYVCMYVILCIYVMNCMYASTAIQASLRHRDATGEGQHIDTCLLDTQVSWLINEVTIYLVSGKFPV